MEVTSLSSRGADHTSDRVYRSFFGEDDGASPIFAMNARTGLFVLHNIRGLKETSNGRHIQSGHLQCGELI